MFSQRAPSAPPPRDKDDGRGTPGKSRRIISPQRGGSALVYSKELDRSLEEVSYLRDNYNSIKYQTSQLSKVVGELQTQCDSLLINTDPKSEATVAVHTSGAPSSHGSSGDNGAVPDIEVEDLEYAVFHSMRKTNTYKFLLQRSRDSKLNLSTIVEIHRRKMSSLSIDESRLSASTRKLENDLLTLKGQHRDLQTTLERQQTRHAKELEDMENMVKERQKLSENREVVSARRGGIVARAQGDLDEVTEKQLKSEIVTNKLKKVRLLTKATEIEAQIELYEENYAKIKQATGINDLDEIVFKLSNQSEANAQIDTMAKEAEKKLAGLISELKQTTQLLREVQLSGLGNLGKQRQEVVQHENELEVLNQSFRSSNASVAFISSILQKSLSAVKYIASKLRDMVEDPINVDDIKEESLLSTIQHFDAKVTQIMNNMSADYKALHIAQLPLKQLIHVDPPPPPDFPEVLEFDMNIVDAGDEDDTTRYRARIKKEVDAILLEANAKRKKLHRNTMNANTATHLTHEEMRALEVELQSVMKKRVKEKFKIGDLVDNDEAGERLTLSGYSISGTRDVSAVGDDQSSGKNRRVSAAKAGLREKKPRRGSIAKKS